MRFIQSHLLNNWLVVHCLHGKTRFHKGCNDKKKKKKIKVILLQHTITLQLNLLSEILFQGNFINLMRLSNRYCTRDVPLKFQT